MLERKLLMVALVICLVWLAVVFDLVRRRRLTEGLSFVWIVGSIGLVVCVVLSKQFTALARFLGIKYPESAVLVLGIGTLSVASLYLCTRITQLSLRVVRLAEEVAILRKRGQERIIGESGSHPLKGPK